MAIKKVLLGESPGCDLDDPLPSRAGMKTVLDVLAIQKNFWPVLESSFSQLQSQYEIYTTQRSKDFLFLLLACALHVGEDCYGNRFN